MKLFEEYPLRNIAPEKLMKVSGVSAFDLPGHFQSSENILKAGLERELDMMAAGAQAPELRMPGETIGDELRILAGLILDPYRRRPGFMGKDGG